ncbi:MAG: dehydrogenase [Chloroflexi bacterium RBG_16_50_11]|nr:MAG: dehydrogenase [Chloroflexi bacterium RBG_16_50_11]
MTGRLEGKTALITGTGGGQGRAAALLFAREGARVVGCDLKVEGAKETEKMVKATGGEMVSIQPVDLGDGNQVKQWIDFAIKIYGRIDILYNNASAPKFAPIEQMTEEEWRFTVRNELDIIYWACHLAWQHLKASGRGVIINIASTAGLVGRAPGGGFAHSAAKGGVMALTRQLAIEGAAYNIRANVISPGIIVSPATEATLQNPESKETMLGMVPLHRFGGVEEIASVALFLASDESSYITGANIVVDGGLTAW